MTVRNLWKIHLLIISAALSHAASPAMRMSTSPAIGCAAMHDETHDDVAALIAEFCGDAPSQSRTPAELFAAYARVLDALLPGMSAASIADRMEPQQQLERIVHHAGRPAADNERTALCQALIAQLSPATPKPARVWMLRKLEMISGDESVPALLACMAEDDVEIRDCARRALQSNPSPDSLNAISGALAGARSDADRIALLNSLGERDAVPSRAILPLVASTSEAVSIAAMAALGRACDFDGIQALAEPWESAEQNSLRRRRALDTMLRVADSCADAGNAKFQRSLLYSLKRSGLDTNLRLAVLAGEVRCRPLAMVEEMIGILNHAEPLILKRTTIQLLARVEGEKAASRVSEALLAATPENKPHFLDVLALRQDASALPTVIATLAGAGDIELRVRALQTIEKIGGAAQVELLAQKAADDAELVRRAAQTALENLRGADVDARILAAAGSGAAHQRAALIRASAARNAPNAKPVYVQMIDDADDSVAAAAWDALALGAGDEDLRAMIDALVRARVAPRGPAENAVAAVALRAASRESCAAALVAHAGHKEAAARASIVRVLGRLECPAALAAIRAARSDAAPEVVDAAIRALAAWPGSDALNDLRQLAGDANCSAAQRVLALRGFVRLIRAGSDRPAGESLALLKDALAMSQSREDKMLVLAALPAAPLLESLRLAESFLSDKELAAEAATATVAVARGVAGSDREAAVTAIRSVESTATADAPRKAASEALKLIDEYRNYIASWEYSGPYFAEGKKPAELYDVAFAPEPGSTDSSAPQTWKPLTQCTPENPWIFDFTRIDKGASRCIYVRTTYRSDSQQTAKLLIGSDDGIQAWLNGALVHTKKVGRAIRPGEDVVDIQLQAGDNLLLLKIVQSDGGWGFCCAIDAGK